MKTLIALETFCIHLYDYFVLTLVFYKFRVKKKKTLLSTIIICRSALDHYDHYVIPPVFIMFRVTLYLKFFCMIQRKYFKTKQY